MHKRPVLEICFFVLLVGVSFGFGVLSCFAEGQSQQAQEESISITTYYPSPYGSYNELRTNKMVIGDVNASTTPSPSQGAATFSPVSEPAAYSEGTLYYDNSAHNFKYRNNSAWQTMGGGGVSYTHYCFSDSSYGVPLCTDAGGSRRYCPSGYTQKLALGSWGFCRGYCGRDGCFQFYFLPPGGSCAPSYGSWVVGQAYVCSQ